jgi:hypothetical protein
MVASMGTTLAHRDEARSAPADSKPAARREAPLATRVSVRRVMRAFKRV